MITKKELITRICDLEADVDYLMQMSNKLEKNLKKLEPKKEKKSVKVSK